MDVVAAVRRARDQVLLHLVGSVNPRRRLEEVDELVAAAILLGAFFATHGYRRPSLEAIAEVVAATREVRGIRAILRCPRCELYHVDRDEWARDRVHRTHLCEHCGHTWQPFAFATVGVEP